MGTNFGSDSGQPANFGDMFERYVVGHDPNLPARDFSGPLPQDIDQWLFSPADVMTGMFPDPYNPTTSDPLGVEIPPRYAVATPSTTSLHSYASTALSETLPFSDYGAQPPAFKPTGILSRATLPARFPGWGGVYEDMSTLGIGMMLVKPLATMWAHHEHIHGTYNGLLVTHPLYPVAHDAMSMMLGYTVSTLETPPVPANGQSLPQTVIQWMLQDMIEYRDDLEKKTLAATFHYGFRRVDDGEGSDPKAVKEEIDLNLQCHATTSTNDAFMHIWQSQNVPRRGPKNRILAPYMNPNVLEPAQSHYYVGKNAIAERMEHLGNKYPLMREQHPELFVWHEELPLTAFVLALTKMKYSVGTWVKGKYQKRTWSSKLNTFFKSQREELEVDGYVTNLRFSLGKRCFNASQLGYHGDTATDSA